MDKKAVARVLDEIGKLLELKGENQFKVRAYQNGARTVKRLTGDLAALVESGDLRKVKGIGSALADKITELVETGSLAYHQKLRDSFPESLFELLRVPGLGPKKIKRLYEDLGISTVEALQSACEQDVIAGLDGFGRKTQEKIVEGIAFMRRHSGRHLYHDAAEAAARLLAVVEEAPGVRRAALAGSLRRHRETVKDIDVVASAAENDRAAIMDAFASFPEVESVTGRGDTKCSVVLKQGISADLRIVSDDAFPYLLHHFTGSKEHNTAMRGHARKLGIKMNEYGLFKEDGERVECADEKEIFGALNMGFIPPELREDMGELDAALAGEIPDLVEGDAIRGILHTHSTWSDGSASLQEMAEACRDMGMEYLGISDHSKSVVYANGLSVDRLREQHDEVQALNEKLGNFRIFHGSECDILLDGTLDYPDDVLEMLDFVVISVHSKLGMGEEEATTRIVRAIEHPASTILGHPTGRLLLDREGYPLDYDRIFAAAAEYGVVIEINASPHRFDLDWRYVKRARDAGVLLSINPDAHSIDGLKDTFWGVGIARKGWLRASDVLNTRNRSEIEDFFSRNRPGN